MKPYMEFETITMFDLRNIMKNIKPSKALGVDSISMKTLKDFLPSIENALLNIINASIVTNTYPTSLNISKIMPQLKPDKDSMDMNGYRPINILNAIAKVIDKVIAEQIHDFLNKFKLIPYNHNGGLKGLSTTTTTIVLLDMWSKLIENNIEAVVLQLDQSSAYDMVCHVILIEKLKILGFNNNSIKWMESYLGNRRQVVEIEGKVSCEKNIGKKSTVQGSVLAGILYLIYTLDFPSYFHKKVNTPEEDLKSNEAVMSTFVDDTNTTIKQKINEQLVNTMKNNLTESENYTNENILALNKTKTKNFALTKNNTIAKTLVLPSDNPVKPITNSKIINMLGITINNELKMNNHVSIGKHSLINQLNLRLIALKKLVRVSDFEFSVKLANSIFQ